jgi:hypothetical protein
VQGGECVFVPRECPGAIFVQASSLPALFDLLGLTRGSPASAQERSSRDTSTAVSDEDAARVLSLIFLHEVGHIAAGTAGSYTGYEKLSFDEINEIAGPTKNVELEADKFAARSLKAGLDLSPLIERQIEEFGKRLPGLSEEEAEKATQEFVTEQRKETHRREASSEVADVLLLVAIKVASQKYVASHPLEPRGQYSHLDIDLRVMILYHLIHPEGHFDDVVRYHLLHRTLP